MANRGITDPALLAITSANSVEYYECVYIGVGAGYYLTNAPRDIAFDGNTYLAIGTLLDFGEVEENVTFEISNLSIRVSGIPAYTDNGNSWTTRILNEEYRNRPVTIARAYFDSADAYVGNFEIYKGYVDSITIKYDPTGDTAVEIETTSHWVDFERSAGRFTNTNSQQHAGDFNLGLAYFVNDLGFDFATRVQKDIEWK